MGYLGSVLLGWMRFGWKVMDPVDPVDPVQSSVRPQNERQYNDFGTFCRNWGAVFDPNLKKLKENQYWNFCPKWTLTQKIPPPKVEVFEENLL